MKLWRVTNGEGVSVLVLSPTQEGALELGQLALIDHMGEQNPLTYNADYYMCVTAQMLCEDTTLSWRGKAET